MRQSKDVPPPALNLKGHQRTSCFALMGQGFISISGFDSVIYLLRTCSRANTHHHSCRLLLLTREQAQIQPSKQLKAACSPASPWDHT